MKIDSIQNGVVIDHITAGNAMRIYNLLGFDKLECSIAIIKNVSSKKMGKKDIIKIDEALDVNLDALGYIDNGITINTIENGVKTTAVKSFTVAGNFYDLLKNITALANNCHLPRAMGSTAFGAPSVLVDGLSVAGK